MKLPSTVLALLLACALVPSAGAQALTDCRLTFSMSGWSVFYKTGAGTGTISCDNGQSMRVRISSKGGGLSFGRSRIVDGRGEFSAVARPDDLLGTYVAAEAHAGAVKSSQAQAMSKGDVSLALAGTGEGWDLGVAFGAFTIER